jgi:hypothetical protein
VSVRVHVSWLRCGERGAGRKVVRRATIMYPGESMIRRDAMEKCGVLAVTDVDTCVSVDDGSRT